MAITKSVRDTLLVEAKHRCTICSEKCFEIHHIIEQAEGGTDDEDNLIVLCPNCHQHRYHRSGEFTRDQLRLYKAKLKESNEIERRLLMNLEEIRTHIGQLSSQELEKQLKDELSEAVALVTPDRSPNLYRTVVETAKELANRGELLGGARKAIEVQFEVERNQAKTQFSKVEIVRIDEDAYRKSDEFPAAYKFELVLNQIPHRDWVNLFDEMYKRNWYNMKRETRIVRDRIQMIVADSDNLQGHVDFAKSLVQQTNEFVFTQGFAEIDRQINVAKSQALREYDGIQSMKERTKNLKL
jgi:HNH endonuclease